MLKINKRLTPILAVGLLSLGLLASNFHAPSAYAATSPRIVFSSDRTGNEDVFIMNEDGSGVINLTDNPGEDVAAQWFPDGSRIVFRSDRTGDFEIYTMKPDGTDIVNISNNPSLVDVPIAISPNGLRLSAYEQVGEDPWSIKSYTINLTDGGDKAMLVPSDSPYATSSYGTTGLALWESNNQSLVTSLIGIDGEGNLDISNPATFQVFRVQQDGSGVQPLITSDNTLVKALPAPSPDGSKIIYTSYGFSQPGSDLRISNSNDDWASSNSVTEVAPSSASQALRNLAFWSPDSSKILFSSSSNGNWDIYTISPDGSNRFKLTDFGDFHTEAYWYGSGFGSGSPSNKIILNTDKDGNKEIYLINSDGTGLTNLTNNSASDSGGFGAVEPAQQEMLAPAPNSPKTGKMIGATIATVSMLAIILLMAKEIKEKHHSWGGER